MQPENPQEFKKFRRKGILSWKFLDNKMSREAEVTREKQCWDKAM